MRGARMLGVLAVAALCVGAFSAVALAGNKKKTTVVVNAGPVLSGQQNVKVRGSLNTATVCQTGRQMRLFLTDQTCDSIDARQRSQSGRRDLEASGEAAQSTHGESVPSGEGEEADRQEVRLQSRPLGADPDPVDGATGTSRLPPRPDPPAPRSGSTSRTRRRRDPRR